MLSIPHYVTFGILCAFACLAQAAEKAPFKLLYGNDTTNLESCVSPFHKAGELFKPVDLKASVDEAVQAGADAYLLQPGFTYVPLWKSKVYPAKEHFEWFYQTFPRTPHTGFADYMMQGGDYLQLYLDACREAKVAAFVSMRVNDYHGLESLDAPEGAKLHPHNALNMDRFRRENPQWRLGNWTGAPVSPQNTFAMREISVMDWAHPQVRARVLAFISEVAAYDIDGMELDFLRHFRLFNPNTTTFAQREKIVTEFVGSVRKALDENAKGKRRWLCVRVPAQAEIQDGMGIDLGALEKAGVDMFNLSSNYYTVQDGVNLAKNRAAAPQAAMYLEMTHVTMVGGDPAKGRGDSNFYRRTTAEQFYTTAHLAYDNGFDGISLFNFQYYREYGNKPQRGPFAEPPFAVMAKLRDKNAVAQSPQFYFLAPVWRSPYGNPVQLPQRTGIGRANSLKWTLVAPQGGFAADARVRIQTQDTLGASTFEARWNGTPLKPTADVAEPYPTPYPHLLGTPQTLRAWVVPKALLASGAFELSVTQTSGKPAVIVFADLSAR